MYFDLKNQYKQPRNTFLFVWAGRGENFLFERSYVSFKLIVNFKIN